MWIIQSSITLNDLPKDFFIVCFRAKEDYDIARFDGPWLVCDHYLHVQRWEPNFLPETAEISHLPVWFRFSLLLVKYYSVQWLQRASNQIGKTI